MTLQDKKTDVIVRPALTQHPSGKEFVVGIHLWGFETEQFREIMLQHLPAFVRLFAEKNAEYGAGQQASGTALGVKGQFADIWRKIGKLKTALWDDNEAALTSEGVDEILLDLIGHAFLTLWMRADTVRNAAPGSRVIGGATTNLSALATAAAPDPFDRVVGIDDPTISPELRSVLQDQIISPPFTSESYEVSPGVWLSAGDAVEFRHHLRRGGTYEIAGFDTQQPDGMVCQIVPQVDRGEVALPVWTNPDWLVLVDQRKEDAGPQA